MTERSIEIIGVDANPMASGLFLVDEAYVVPEAATERYVDAMVALDAAGRDRPIADLVPSHYSPLANQLVAEQLLGQLRALELVPK